MYRYMSIQLRIKEQKNSFIKGLSVEWLIITQITKKLTRVDKMKTMYQE